MLLKLVDGLNGVNEILAGEIMLLASQIWSSDNSWETHCHCDACFRVMWWWWAWWGWWWWVMVMLEVMMVIVETVILMTVEYWPTGDVEEVTAHRGGDGHVPKALPGHDDGGDEVRDGGAGCQDGQPHHLQQTNTQHQHNTTEQFRSPTLTTLPILF